MVDVATSALAKGDTRMQGKMLWFNEVKNFGFIATEEGERLYVNRSGFAGKAPVGRCAGLAVTFEIGEADGQRAAVDVAPVPETVQRRARIRRSGAR